MDGWMDKKRGKRVGELCTVWASERKKYLKKKKEFLVWFDLQEKKVPFFENVCISVSFSLSHRLFSVLYILGLLM